MKMGISVWAFPGDWGLRRIFQTAKEAGFEGVEVALAENGEINLSSTKEDMYSIKAVAEEVGIQLYSVASGLYWSYSFTSNQEEIRNKAKEIGKKQLEIANYLGCDTILVVPGSVGVDFIPNCEIVEYDIAYVRALSSMIELKRYAEKLEVSIGIENVWNKFLLSPLEFRDFIDKIDSKFVGAYFDVGNVLQTGYPEQWIKILGDRIKKIHFKDYQRSIGTLEGFVDMLSGDVNYPAVIAQLRKINYNDWVTAEVGIYKDYPEESIFNTANSMKAILKAIK
ncbi:MAG TPA: sugar phosphate isomerase/epimerase family protein [Clostridiaceae bacterium]